ncbi:MAG: FAD-dependent oxidoreductase [Candidatus Caenarcaniphilales bacterium]|nr:FAD-dependent oxidoreductase [Candidatus Caenarcaniphilales bacterium]
MKVLSALILSLIALSIRPAIADTFQTDVLVVGGSQSGVAAAVEAARQGSKVVLISESDWLGGSLVEAGVSAVDGSELDSFRTGIWGEFIRRLSAINPDLSRYGWVSLYTFDPRYGKKIFQEMIEQEPNITWLKNYRPKKVLYDSSGRFRKVIGVDFDKGLTAKAKVTIDATELGDLLAIGKIPYRIGWEYYEEFKEPSAPTTYSKLTRTYQAQSPTWVFYLQDFGKESQSAPQIPPPSGYSYRAASEKFWCAFKNEKLLNKGSLVSQVHWAKVYEEEEKIHGRIFSAESFMGYGQVSPDLFMINWPRCGNDYGIKVDRIFSADPLERENFYREARAHSLWFARYIQDTLGRRYGLAAEVFSARPANGQIAGLAYIPYYREARRLVGYETFSERMFLPNLSLGENSAFLKDSIAIGNYLNDHHYPGFQDTTNKLPLAPKAIPWGGRTTGTPFAIPYRALLPIKVNGLLVIEKSFSVSHIANGVSRLQPVCLQIGQAAGAAAALASKGGIDPFDVKVSDIQDALLYNSKSPATTTPLFDLPLSERAFSDMQKLILAGVIEFPPSGYIEPQRIISKEIFDSWLSKANHNYFSKIGTKTTRSQAASLIIDSIYKKATPIADFNLQHLETYCGELSVNKPGGNSYKLKNLLTGGGEKVIRESLSGKNEAKSASLITTNSDVYAFMKAEAAKSPQVCIYGRYNYTANWILAYKIAY